MFINVHVLFACLHSQADRIGPIEELPSRETLSIPVLEMNLYIA